MRDAFRLIVCIILLLRYIGTFSLSTSPSFLRHGYFIFFWILVSVVAYHQQWNGDAARWTKRVWPCLIIYAVLIIGIRYLYLFVSDSIQSFKGQNDFEKAFGLVGSISKIQSGIYTYFASDATLVVLFFIQGRRFSKLQKTSTWQWPDSPLRFQFPKLERIFKNLLAVHGEKGFLVSLIVASLANGVNVIGCIWALFFTFVVLSRTALEFSWVAGLVFSMAYCTLALIAPMPVVDFPGQMTNSAQPCDTNCVMGFVGFRAIIPYNFSSCPSFQPCYCKNISLSDQLLVALCVAVSAAFMRLGTKCPAPEQMRPLAWRLTIFAGIARRTHHHHRYSTSLNVLLHWNPRCWSSAVTRFHHLKRTCHHLLPRLCTPIRQLHAELSRTRRTLVSMPVSAATGQYQS
jgi:hypothetical protein